MIKNSAKYKPYPAYKPSGVEWLGNIPAHWEIKRLKYAADLNPKASEVRSLPPETESLSCQWKPLANTAA